MGLEFSFDSKGFRNALADSLKEARKSDSAEALIVLERERTTLQYNIARDIQRMKRDFQIGGENKVEFAEAQEAEEEEQRIIDSEGVEHLLVIHKMDITNQIPESVKLQHDLYRLAVLNHKLQEQGLKPRERSADGEPLVSDGTHSLLQEYLRRTLNESDQQLLLKEDIDLSEEDRVRCRMLVMENLDQTEEIYKKATSDRTEFINKITSGAFLDENVFNHVVGPFDGGYIKISSENDNRLRNRFPQRTEEGEFNEQPLDIHKLESQDLWFRRGGGGYNPTFLATVLCDSRSARFQNEIQKVNFETGMSGGTTAAPDYMRKENPDQYGDSIPVEEQLAAVPGGAHIYFKQKEPWILLADWIVDLYHGRLFKIVERA